MLPTWSCFVHIDFKLFIMKQNSERTFGPPLFPAQEIHTGNPALGRESGLTHLKDLHPSVSQEDSKPVN